jgi:hypothetical protein
MLARNRYSAASLIRIARLCAVFVSLATLSCFFAPSADAQMTAAPVVLGSAGNGSGLMQASDGNYYGTNAQESAYTHGYIYRVTPAGTLTDIYDFTGANDGGDPVGTLIEGKDGNLYGVTQASSIFKISLGGSFTLLGATPSPWAPTEGFFPASDGNFYVPVEHYSTSFVSGLLQYNPVTNVSTVIYSSGADLLAAVQASDGLLYFTVEVNGTDSLGTVNSMNLDGSNVQLLHTFTDTTGDGAIPLAPLVQIPGGSRHRQELTHSSIPTPQTADQCSTWNIYKPAGLVPQMFHVEQFGAGSGPRMFPVTNVTSRFPRVRPMLRREKPAL